MNRITLSSLIAVAGALSATPALAQNCYWDNEIRNTPACVEQLRQQRENFEAAQRKAVRDLATSAAQIARENHVSTEEAWRLMNATPDEVSPPYCAIARCR